MSREHVRFRMQEKERKNEKTPPPVMYLKSCRFHIFLFDDDVKYPTFIFLKKMKKYI